MPKRRSVLKILASLALPVLPGAARAVPVQPSGAVPLGDGMFLVDGWVLTRRDLEEGVRFDAA
jgi:hypothetical protein